MSEQKAKDLLVKILGNFTTGRILGLLSELHFSSAEEAREARDPISSAEFIAVSRTLEVVGVGIDARFPQ